MHLFEALKAMTLGYSRVIEGSNADAPAIIAPG